MLIKKYSTSRRFPGWFYVPLLRLQGQSLSRESGNWKRTTWDPSTVYDVVAQRTWATGIRRTVWKLDAQQRKVTCGCSDMADRGWRSPTQWWKKPGLTSDGTAGSRHWRTPDCIFHPNNSHVDVLQLKMHLWKKREVKLHILCPCILTQRQVLWFIGFFVGNGAVAKPKFLDLKSNEDIWRFVPVS